MIDPAAILHQYYYNFDTAGNRTSQQVDANVTQTTSNNLNQITSQSAGGATRFQGTITQPGTVKVNGQAAYQATSTNFWANPVLTSGTNTVAVVATNGNGAAQTNNYQVVIPASSTVTPTYDANGNMTNNGNGRTYAWDAENRLIKITYTSGATSNFAYDALGRRVSIIEKNSAGTTYNTQQFLYAGGTQMAEERDSSGTTVSKQYYAQGENVLANYDPKGPTYFTFDHLGSLREAVQSTTTGGTLTYHYDYDPYGQATFNSNFAESISIIQQEWYPESGYGGMYQHQTSNLNLTSVGNTYDSTTGRWLGRDPLGEDAAINLYAYVGNDPINFWDPYGLKLLISGSDAFIQSTLNALHKIGSHPNGLSLIQKIIASKFTVTIQDSTCTDPDNDTNGTAPDAGSLLLNNIFTSGNGSDATINYDTSSTSNNDGPRPNYVGLAHELGHAEDIISGNEDLDTSRGPDGIPKSEANAVNRENQVRSENNVPIRQWGSGR